MPEEKFGTYILSRFSIQLPLIYVQLHQPNCPLTIGVDVMTTWGQVTCQPIAVLESALVDRRLKLTGLRDLRRLARISK